MSLRFDNKVVVVTGAGGGLGRAYALAFAKRGAKVVVNDLGVSTHGEGSSSRAADKVVDDIVKAGGEATANYDSVEDGAKIIKTAITKYGRVDVLINNAGILRDVSFAKMTEKDWDLVMQVHLKGSFNCSKAAWPYMQKQGYGRIINTASAAGLYGNFGQANYSTAKLALVALAKTLAQEGEKKNILCNAIAPLAGTRMTETVMPKQVVDALKPEYIVPLVTYLCHDSSKQTGQIFEVGAGWIAALRWQRTEGVMFPPTFTAEDVANKWSQVTDWSKVTYPNTLQESMQFVMQRLEAFQNSGGDGASDEYGSARESGPSSSGAGSGLSPQAQQLKAAPIVAMMQQHMKTDAGKKLCDKVGHVYRFDVAPQKGKTPVVFTIDLKNAPGAIHEGEPKGGQTDAHFTMVDEDFVKVVTGTLNPQIAFMQGKMKVKGSMKAAMKFTPDLFPPPSKL